MFDEAEPERDLCLCLSRLAIGSKSWSMWDSAKRLSSISLQVTFIKMGFGCKICLKTGCDSWDSLDRGMWTRERETGSRETVTLEDAKAMNKKMDGRKEKEKEGETRTELYEGSHAKTYVQTFDFEIGVI